MDRTRRRDRTTDTESQVKHHHVCVEVLVVVTVLWVEGEVCIGFAPRSIWEHRLSARRPLADNLWDILNFFSWKEPDLNRVCPSVHDIPSATVLIERGAVG